MSSSTSPIVVPNLQVGGITFTDLTNLIVLIGQFDGTGGANTGFRALSTPASAPADYTPSGSKKFNAWAWRLHGIPSALTSFSLLYADNNPGYGVSAAFTNPKYMCGLSSYKHFTSNVPAQSGISEGVALGFSVPNGKYPGAVGYLNPGFLYLFGYEQ